MHAQAVRRMGHVAIALLVDAHDVLPAGAAETQRRVGHRRQHGRPAEQRIDQRVVVGRLREIVVGTGAQGADHRGEAVGIGDHHDTHGLGAVAQPLHEGEAVAVALPQIDDGERERPPLAIAALGRSRGRRQPVTTEPLAPVRCVLQRGAAAREHSTSSSGPASGSRALVHGTGRLECSQLPIPSSLRAGSVSRLIHLTVVEPMAIHAGLLATSSAARRPSVRRSRTGKVVCSSMERVVPPSIISRRREWP